MSLNKLQIPAALLTLALLSSTAYAQGVKDLRGLNTPAELIPAAQDDAPDYDMMTEGRADIGEVAVLDATNISLDTLGLYDEKSGGLAFDVWDGSSHDRVKLLLNQLPQTIPSPTVRALVAKLLLSTTRPPESENIRQQVFAERINTLLHIDQVAQAQRLLESVPQAQRDARTAQLEYTTHLLSGDAAWVCDNIGEALGKYAGSSGQWQKYSIFCFARQGDEARAQLALDLLAEQQVDMDAGFLAFTDVLLGRKDKLVTRFSAPLALDEAAMIALSGKDAFPEGYLATAPLPVVRLVKQNDAFSAELRKQADARLAAAIAVEKPNKERVAMQSWFASQFAQSAESRFDFDRAMTTMKDKGGSKGEPRDTRRRYRFYTMLQALGFSDITATVDWDNATFKDSGRIHVSPVLRSEMASAVDKELRGESILLLAMAAGQVDDLADVDDASIADMVQALMQLGYTAEAQALAAEAMTALY